MEREEIEAMWERIKALEENMLKVTKAMVYESILSTNNLVAWPLATAGKKQAYMEYMKPKVDQAKEAVLEAESVDKVVELLRAFNFDCISFMVSVVGHG